MARAITTITLNFTTDAQQAATVTAPVPQPMFLLEAEWVDGDVTDGVDAVLSCISTPSGIDKTLLTLTNANSDARYPVREVEYDTAGAALATRTLSLVEGTLQLAVTSGGVGKIGKMLVKLLEP